MHDEFFCVTKAWEILTQKGYRRIGMLLPDYPESPSNNLRLAAALVCQDHTHPDNRVPSLFSGYEDQFDQDQFRKWMDRYKPDVLLANTHVRINDLLECGLRIPEDIPFAASNLWDPEERGNIAGFFRANLDLFEQGIQLLNMMIRSGTVGTARASLVELVKGEWIEGKSLP
jgi:LacI family transcriptional regulator